MKKIDAESYKKKMVLASECSVLRSAPISNNSLKSLFLLESSNDTFSTTLSLSVNFLLQRVSTLSLSLSLSQFFSNFFFPFPNYMIVSFCLCRWRRRFFSGFHSILLLNMCFLWLINVFVVMFSDYSWCFELPCVLGFQFSSAMEMHAFVFSFIVFCCQFVIF